jgi:hypothetical protein
MNAFTPTQQRTPDITLPGAMVEQIVQHLNNGVVFAKVQDGSMRPFVDPQPILALLAQAAQAAQRPPGGDVSTN